MYSCCSLLDRVFFPGIDRSFRSSSRNISSFIAEESALLSAALTPFEALAADALLETHPKLVETHLRMFTSNCKSIAARFRFAGFAGLMVLEAGRNGVL